MSKVFTITEGLENLGALRTGGQGSVYKGRRTGTVYTAIKLLPTPIHTESEDDKNYRNFQNEVAKLQKVNEQPNPHVVKIMSWGLTDSGSFPFIEMEYIEGPDLCELLQEPHDNIFSLKELIKVADQLAGALAHCHKLGIKHGDIKSNNVKYNIHTGNYMLLDFGLAIMTDEQRRSSIRHAGAIEFMAPEQHDGVMLPQTDVYSFGIVMYELLTGQVPFPLNGNGETGRNHVMLSHIETPVPDALAKRRENLPKRWAPQQQAQEMQVPEWLLHIIDICLEKDPAKRYASGVELQEAIVNGSLSASNSNSMPAASALQTENEQLQAEVLQLKQAGEEQEKQLTYLKSLIAQTGGRFNQSKGIFERNKAVMYLPKWAVAGLGVFAAVFMLLYAFTPSAPNQTAYNNASITQAATIKKYVSPYLYKRPVKKDTVFIASNGTEIKRSDFAFKRPVAKGKGKKKHKKFLGIF
jgi:serine/threonine protein kinase